MVSALTEDIEHCYVCGRPEPQMHHCIYGTGNRSISNKYQYIIPLCMDHHTGRDGVHNGNKALDMHLKQLAQKHFERYHGSREDFIRVFGKSYL